MASDLLLQTTIFCGSNPISMPSLVLYLLERGESSATSSRGFSSKNLAGSFVSVVGGGVVGGVLASVMGAILAVEAHRL